jgi:hypothetical protein
MDGIVGVESRAPQAGALAKELYRLVGGDICVRRWEPRNLQLEATGAKFWCTVGAQ